MKTDNAKTVKEQEVKETYVVPKAEVYTLDMEDSILQSSVGIDGGDEGWGGYRGR